MIGFVPGQGLVRLVIGQFLLDSIKQTSVHDCWLFSREDFAFVFDLANKEAIAK